MCVKDNSSKDKQYERNESVKELIYENIYLWDENWKLTYENELLKRRIEDLKRLNKRDSINPLVKVGRDLIVIFLVRGKKGNSN